VYEETLEDNGRFNEQPVLPFNAYGTIAMARSEFEANDGSSQIFFLLKVPSTRASFALTAALSTAGTCLFPYGYMSIICITTRVCLRTTERYSCSTRL
jgi:cyclophilin family peptidyl-prolyl cis-trans isomerase